MPTVHKLLIAWTKVMDFPPRIAPQERRSCLIKSCKFSHVTGFSFHCFMLKHHITLKWPNQGYFSMLIEVPSTDWGIIPLGVTSQWQLLEFVLNAPFRNHAAKHCGYTGKVMNICKSTNKWKSYLWLRIKISCLASYTDSKVRHLTQLRWSSLGNN